MEEEPTRTLGPIPRAHKAPRLLPCLPCLPGPSVTLPHPCCPSASFGGQAKLFPISGPSPVGLLFRAGLPLIQLREAITGHPLSPQPTTLYRPLDSFALAAIIKQHRRGGLNNRNVWSHSSGGRSRQGWFLLRVLREGSVPGLSPQLTDGHLNVHIAFSLYLNLLYLQFPLL